MGLTRMLQGLCLLLCVASLASCTVLLYPNSKGNPYVTETESQAENGGLSSPEDNDQSILGRLKIPLN